MNADSFYVKGKTHEVCQDYAVVKSLGKSNTDGQKIFNLTVADGCSSSNDTDIGARILAQIRSNLKFTTVGLQSLSIFLRAKNIIELMDLPLDVLHSTLLFATVLDGHVHVICSGDGCFAYKKKNGDIYHHELSFGNNMPNYFLYHFQEQAREQYFKYIQKADEHMGAKLESCYFNGEFITGDYYFLNPINPLDSFWLSYHEFPVKDLLYFMIATDGIGSFKSQSMNNQYNEVSSYLVLQQLFDIKSNTGFFLKRRSQKFLNKYCVKNNWTHDDDVGVAMISFD